MNDTMNNGTSHTDAIEASSGKPMRGRVYVETYGCQMNASDSEIVLSIMRREGFAATEQIGEADVVLINTCSIRDNAEQRIHSRLRNIAYQKKRNPDLVVGILGCMAERLRKDLLGPESIVDVVVGPDEYRALPVLVDEARVGDRGIAVKLSRVETYDDISPLRTDGISAWVSVMRGCDKFCTFCVVPFTRGRERSRSVDSVVREIETLAASGFREVTLLGQNVNSYRSDGKDFADLLVAVADVDPRMRVRYTTSHPQDMSDKLIDTMASRANICSYVHLPVQSGSDRILTLMNRTYTLQHYVERVSRIRQIIPDCALSTDIITGFPTETEDDHKRTVAVLEQVGFDGAYMFAYSPRENTKAWAMGDDVSDEIKGRRLNEVIAVQHRISHERNQRLVGTTEEVLIDGPSRRDVTMWRGRTDSNKVVVFPQGQADVGDFVRVHIARATSATLVGSMEDENGDRSYIPLNVIEAMGDRPKLSDG